ncbi:DEAD/DEAH box helicase [uncultured Paracoccus sp.]|uniref:DEAD/DEAH box helicase n=1 Tax=uncultured Paracoccus sp. TaxID=189685 RepID=UPI0025FF1BB6|nr:DEAD/DEAH box helicase [uncultured Paracoccus sp.]
MGKTPLAHSARTADAPPQTYAAHIAGTSHSEGVVDGAGRRATAMLSFHSDPNRRILIAQAIEDAATFHDLGKIDPDVQAALARGRGERLDWDHIDAGVAHLRSCGAEMAAWLVRAHHAPGLPSQPVHFTSKHDRRLRGRRRDDDAYQDHQSQIDRTNDLLAKMLEEHEAAIGYHQPARGKTVHGLPLRLALSCLVDADHADSAHADTGWTEPRPPLPRWPERLAALDAYVARLGQGGGARDVLRRRFYEACRGREPGCAFMACEGPVGVGKTTAVTAYALNRALATGARRLFVVAPYTAILSQTAERLRKALVLEDEKDMAELVVVEHHHRADFSSLPSRDLAALWNAPIVLTTAVQFFGTLSANTPSDLRKLHSLPGSVVFVDETHASLPAHLWPQNWLWLRELSTDWGCSFVFASGSLARFWEVDDIVGDARATLPELVPEELVAPLRQAEAKRVSYVSEGHLDGPRALIEKVAASPGPRLLIMNTVQSAAALVLSMRQGGHDVLHLSTALAPRDRERILEVVKTRLDANSPSSDWTLVATSLMEAGVDLSFRTPFRERFSTASLIQISGRGNRNAEWSEGVTVHDFTISHSDGLKAHPAANIPANILARLFEQGKFRGQIDPAELVTLAMRMEMRQRNSGHSVEMLVDAENERRYPDVAEQGRVIESDTRLVVVDSVLRDRLIGRDKVATRDLLAGSVQVWANRTSHLGLDPLPGREDIYWWPHAYDPNFLGYMAGALFLDAVSKGEAVIF